MSIDLELRKLNKPLPLEDDNDVINTQVFENYSLEDKNALALSSLARIGATVLAEAWKAITFVVSSIRNLFNRFVQRIKNSVLVEFGRSVKAGAIAFVKSAKQLAIQTFDDFVEWTNTLFTDRTIQNAASEAVEAAQTTSSKISSLAESGLNLTKEGTEFTEDLVKAVTNNVDDVAKVSKSKQALDAVTNFFSKNTGYKLIGFTVLGLSLWYAINPSNFESTFKKAVINPGTKAAKAIAGALEKVAKTVISPVSEGVKSGLRLVGIIIGSIIGAIILAVVLWVIIKKYAINK